MNFRQDINILRGISILLVVIFHFFPKILPNGYLGVDVFFIISGFLITLGILKEKDKNNFSYKEFYKRRIHRIIPAVLVMLVIVTIFEFFILLPSDLIKYASSLESTLFFISNIHFFLNGGYFGGNDEIKPLLHMWSLSIEEQFYILFPVVLVLCIKFIRNYKYLISLILVIAFFSYFLNIYLSNIGGKNAAFFLLPTRIWQFLVGAISAYIIYKNNGETFKYKYLSLIGLFLIISSLFFKPELIPDATIISIGVFLIIINSLNIHSNLFTNFISFLGKISFSLYLWHWPIASFLNYYNIQNIEVWQSILGIILSLIISYFSWKYVEEKFRKPKNTKRLLIGIGVVYLALIGTSYTINKYLGFPQRYNPEINEIAMAVDSNFRCPKLKSFLYGGSKACLIELNNEKNFDTAILGNSHSLMYAPVISNALNKSVLVIPLNGCTPTTSINLNNICMNQFKENLNELTKDNHIKRVIIGTTWGNEKMINSKNDSIQVTPEIFNNSLLSTVKYLKDSGKKVYLIGPIQTPTPGNNFASNLSRGMALGHDINNIKQKESIDVFLNKHREHLDFWEKELGNFFIPSYKSLCDDRFCYFRKPGSTYFADDNHLSLKGAYETKKIFINSFN